MSWWLTTIRTAEQEEWLWPIEKQFCFVNIVTEAQTVLQIKGKHDTIKFSLKIIPGTKPSAKNTVSLRR